VLDPLFQIGALVVGSFILPGIHCRWLRLVLVSSLCGKAKGQKQ
jgi:hypothetical protein